MKVFFLLIFILSPISQVLALETGDRVILQQEISLKPGKEIILSTRHLNKHPCILSYDNETDEEVIITKGTYFRVIFAEQLVSRTAKFQTYGETFISLAVHDDYGGFTKSGKEVRRNYLIKISCHSSGEFVSGMMAKMNTPSVRRTLKTFSDYFVSE